MFLRKQTTLNDGICHERFIKIDMKTSVTVECGAHVTNFSKLL